METKKKGLLRKVVLFVGLALIVGCIGLFILGLLLPEAPADEEATKIPETEPTPTRIPLRRWISGVRRCPTSEYYGDLETETAGLYSDMDAGPANMIARVPHGAQVAYHPFEGDDEDMCKIEYDGTAGFTQCMFLVTYDPAGGVQPDESQCW